MTTLEVRDICVRYGSAVAVDGATFTAPSGTVTAVVGPNGAGKSSLFGAIYGSTRATGSVTVDGLRVDNLSAARRAREGFAYVPQGRQLFMKMSVLENLRVGADLVGLGKDSVDSAFDRFPVLRERAHSYAGVLSGGEQQMLVLGRALLATPKVLLLDEMTTGLAPKIVGQLRTLVADLATEGVTVLIAEPSLAALAPIVARGYVMQRGEIIVACDDAAALDTAYKQSMGVVDATRGN
ncbi:ABC transporter ATP-binding protein [Rhodococcus kronopolitis]|uniref:ABC transporter ATP-binding protein n=1 Tax=Rhodococcus kronopolitis TaxID=1460226 RepID=A0ABV9FVK8_9NOCA